MKAKEYVKKHFPCSYVWSPCTNTFVVKNGTWEIGDRAKNKRRAWVNAKERLMRATRASKEVDVKSKAAGDRETKI